MRLAHLADLHLGFRRYAAVTADGRNQREQDVSDAFARVVEQVTEARPDLILVAGDVFDMGHPGNRADADAVAGFQALRRVAPVLIVAGNHDEALEGSPLAILGRIGCKVVLRAERVAVPHLNAHVLCVPDCDVRRVKLAPSDAEGTHLLLAHGSIGGRLASLGVDVLDPSAISPDFAYAALGDYHRTEQVAPNAWYAGAIEHTSSDVWRDADVPKGWLLVDTDAGTVEHQAVPTRPHVDLPRLSGAGLTGAELTEQILTAVAAVPGGAVVRQVVVDCHRITKSALGFKRIKQATARLVAWQLDIRKPETVQVGTVLPDDDTPDWTDSFNADEPALVADDFSIYEALQRGEMPALDPNADPYGLTAAPPRAAAA